MQELAADSRNCARVVADVRRHIHAKWDHGLVVFGGLHAQAQEYSVD